MLQAAGAGQARADKARDFFHHYGQQALAPLILQPESGVVGPPAGQLLDAVGYKGTAAAASRAAAAASLLGHRALGWGLGVRDNTGCV